MSRKCLTRFYVPVYGNIGVVFDGISAISNFYPQIPVNSGRFEDPCKGTYKYLEVEHTCQGKVKYTSHLPGVPYISCSFYWTHQCFVKETHSYLILCFLSIDICPNEADFVFSGKVRRTNGKNALRHRCFKVWFVTQCL